MALFDGKVFCVSKAGSYYYGNIQKDQIKVEKQYNLIGEGDDE